MASLLRFRIKEHRPDWVHDTLSRHGSSLSFPQMAGHILSKHVRRTSGRAGDRFGIPDGPWVLMRYARRSRMYQFFQDLTSYALPVFVIATMFNVGLTQKPSAITENLRNWHFLVRMMLANFIIVPALMYTLVNLVGDYTPAQSAGLMIMGVCAGAPFLIKLTQTSENDIALGATVMMVLMVATVIVAPVLLPVFIEGLEVDAWGIAQSLFIQMLLPIIVGMILAQVVSSIANTIQSWVARIGNLALYVVLGATIIGYWPEIQDLVGTGAIAGGLVVLLIAFFVGYLFGDGKDHLQDVGGLGTAQRNTAATMIIASDNFIDPTVFVIVSVVNALGIVMLMLIARLLSRDAGDATDDDPERGDNRIFVDQRYLRANRPTRKRTTAKDSPPIPASRA
jgi:bile acid:Na+ symporter, BASS family